MKHQTILYVPDHVNDENVYRDPIRLPEPKTCACCGRKHYHAVGLIGRYCDRPIFQFTCLCKSTLCFRLTELADRPIMEVLDEILRAG